jgi:hypothetical protein
MISDTNLSLVIARHTSMSVRGAPFSVIARSVNDEAIYADSPSPMREGVRGRGKFTLTLFLSPQGRGDFSGDCHAEFTPSYARFFAPLRMTQSEGPAMTEGSC